MKPHKYYIFSTISTFNRGFNYLYQWHKFLTLNFNSNLNPRTWKWMLSVQRICYLDANLWTHIIILQLKTRHLTSKSKICSVESVDILTTNPTWQSNYYLKRKCVKHWTWALIWRAIASKSKTRLEHVLILLVRFLACAFSLNSCFSTKSLKLSCIK